MSPRRTPERAQFLRDLLHDALGSATYWSGVIKWTKDGAIIADFEDDAEPHYTANIAAIARGIGIAKKKGLSSSSGQEYIKQWWQANATNGADGDYDSEITDQLLQYGLFGEVVYS